MEPTTRPVESLRPDDNQAPSQRWFARRARTFRDRDAVEQTAARLPVLLTVDEAARHAAPSMQWLSVVNCPA